MLQQMAIGADPRFSVEAGGEIRLLHTTTVFVPEDHHRTVDQDHVDSLKKSIEVNGLLSPIGVQPVPGKGYRLIFGQHRLTAWKQLLDEYVPEENEKDPERWERIPCIVYNTDIPDEGIKLLELQENFIRKELSKHQRDWVVGEILKLRHHFIKPKKRKKIEPIPIPEPKLVTQVEVAKAWGIKPDTLKKAWKRYMKENGIESPSKSCFHDNHREFVSWYKNHSKKEISDEKVNLFSSPQNPDLPSEQNPDDDLIRPRSMQDFANLLQMGYSSVYDRWDRFRKLTNQPQGVQFSTCDESIIDEFASWLQDEDRKRQDEEIYQAKIEEHQKEQAIEAEYQEAISAKKIPAEILIPTSDVKQAVSLLLKFYKRNDIIKALA